MMNQESTAHIVCGNCSAEDQGLLHHVRHRGTFRRLCTTCIIRLHPHSFCPTCFLVYDGSPPNDAVTCLKCHSFSHSGCFAGPTTPSKSPYVCPCCVNPSLTLFALQESNGNRRVIDKNASRVLLTAAKIASISMNRAAVAARAGAERRGKEAAFTRKRAKEALDHVLYLTAKEKHTKIHTKFVNHIPMDSDKNDSSCEILGTNSENGRTADSANLDNIIVGGKESDGCSPMLEDIEENAGSQQ